MQSNFCPVVIKVNFKADKNLTILAVTTNNSF